MRTDRRLLLVIALVIVMLAPARADDELLRLHLMWTNDLHGHIAPEPARFMNPEFPPPLGHGVGHHPVDPHRSQEHPQDPEETQRRLAEQRFDARRMLDETEAILFG